MYGAVSPLRVFVANSPITSDITTTRRLTAQNACPMNKPTSNDHHEDRRRFLKLLSAGGAAALLPGCGAPETPEAAEEAPAFFKDTTPFVRHGETNLEAKPENFGGFLTPAEHFFVRNNASSIAVEAASYRLEVEGDAVETPLCYRMLNASKVRFGSLGDIGQARLQCLLPSGKPT